MRCALFFLALVVACSKPTGTPAPIGSVAPKPYEPASSSRVGTLAPNTGVAIGSSAPDARAHDLDGKEVVLSSLWKRGPILLVFYRGGWCPYCNFQIHTLSADFSEYRKRGVTPVAVSVDKPDVESITKATYAIPFPVLSDTDAAVIDAFHVAKKITPDEATAMKAHGVDLHAQSAQSEAKIAIPALFLIDTKGIVRWAHSDPDFKTRPTTAQILVAIDAVHLQM